MHVHPMSNDGQQDFFTITGIESVDKLPSQIAVIHNSILTTTMIAQNVFNYSSFQWRAVLWNFIEHIRDAISTGDKEYMLTYMKIVKLKQDKQNLTVKDA
ncbi:MAG: DUF5677 domain-containing protein, partial [Vibrio litoralis]